MDKQPENFETSINQLIEKGLLHKSQTQGLALYMSELESKAEQPPKTITQAMITGAEFSNLFNRDRLSLKKKKELHKIQGALDSARLILEETQYQLTCALDDNRGIHQ